MNKKMVRFGPQVPEPIGGGGFPREPEPVVYPKIGAWNRLEGRPRQKDFDKVLSAEVHDALWMLTRQWQFGEFKGEDTGSAIKAKVRCRINPVSRFAVGANPTAAEVQPYHNEVPIEAMVECEPMVFDLKTHLQVTKYWKRLLLQADLPASVFDVFLAEFPLAAPQFGGDEAQEKADHYTEPKTVATYAMMVGKVMDGAAFYQAIGGITNVQDILEGPLASQEQLTKINECLAKFKVWFAGLYVQPASQASAWNAQKLEYQFAQAVIENDQQTALVAEEYYHGHLDWYAFDVNHKSSDFHALKTTNLAGENRATFYKNLTLIPVEARFAGMPASRWWEFEDAVVNFGNIDASTTDVAKVLLAEFGLIYAHEWQIIPFRIPVGHFCAVEDIVVTDVFGQKTKVLAANQNADGGWSFFHLNNQIKDNSGEADGRLLLPSTLLDVQESKPIELVYFQRDEMANMAWAIENTIPGAFGRGRDAYEAFLARQEYFGRTTSQVANTDATFSYQFIAEDDIPDNWIPFIPVKIDAQQDLREIQFLRGAIEKKLPANSNGKVRVRPFGVLLNEVSPPYLIHEEEIPRSGIQVSRTYQRTRWMDGKVFTWLGRRKKTGRGELTSGLAFDRLQ